MASPAPSPKVVSVAETTEAGDSVGDGSDVRNAAISSSSAAAGAAAAEDEVQGVRATKMKEALRRATDKYCRAASHLLPHFPGLKGHRGEYIKSTGKALSTYLQDSITVDYNERLARRDVVRHLNRLDEITSDSALRTSDGSPAWRPSGDPVADVNCADVAGAKAYEELSQTLAELKKTTAQLEETVRNRERQLETKMESLRSTMAVSNELLAACGDLPFDEISSTILTARKASGRSRSVSVRSTSSPPAKRKRNNS